MTQCALTKLKCPPHVHISYVRDIPSGVSKRQPEHIMPPAISLKEQQGNSETKVRRGAID